MRPARFLSMGFGTLCVAWACLTFAPPAQAQFFQWFTQPKQATPKPAADRAAGEFRAASARRSPL